MIPDDALTSFVVVTADRESWEYALQTIKRYPRIALPDANLAFETHPILNLFGFLSDVDLLEQNLGGSIHDPYRFLPDYAPNPVAEGETYFLVARATEPDESDDDDSQ